MKNPITIYFILRNIFFIFRGAMGYRVTEPCEIMHLRANIGKRLQVLFNKSEQYLHLEHTTYSQLQNDLCNLVDRSMAFYQDQFLPDILSQVYTAAFNYALKEAHSSKHSVIYTTNTKQVLVDNSLLRDLITKTSSSVKATMSTLGSLLRKTLGKIFTASSQSQNQVTSADAGKTRGILRKVIDTIMRKTQDAVTEVQADGKLDAYGQSNIQHVQVRVETVQDKRRCRHCAGLQGKQMTIEQARGLLPVHPNCRCLWYFTSLKHIPRRLQMVQREQKRKVMKLRERLDRRYRLKHGSITNEACHAIGEVFSFDRLDNALYGSIHHTHSEQPYYLVLNDIPMHVRKDKCCVINAKQYVKPGRYHGREEALTIPTGSVLKCLGADDDYTYFSVLCNTVPDEKKTQYREAIGANTKMGQRLQTLPLVPNEFEEYPYQLAYRDGVSVVMLSSRRGYIDINGISTPIVIIERLLDSVMKSKLLIG